MRVSNKDIWQMTRIEDMTQQMKRRRWQLIGHALTMIASDHSKVALTWTPESKRWQIKRDLEMSSRQRKGGAWFQRLVQCCRLLVHRSPKNRETWRERLQGPISQLGNWKWSWWYIVIFLIRQSCFAALIVAKWNVVLSLNFLGIYKVFHC